MDVFDLVAKITLDSKDFTAGLDSAEGAASKFGGAASTIFKGVGVAMAGLVTGAVAIGTALVKGAGEVAEYGDKIDKMSQKMGISAEAYQEWDAILQHSGSSIDSMQRGMMTLAQQAEKDSEAFQQLGISQEQVASMSQEELFAEVVKGLQGMEEGSERAVLAQKLLGGAAKELGPLLNTTAEETEAMRQRVHELGGVMSDEAVKNAAAYQDALQDMQTAFQGLSRGLLSEFMPSITSVMGGLTEIFSGNSDKGIQMISEGIDDLAQKILDGLPQFLDLGMSILDTLVKSLINELPKLLGAAGKIIGKLIAGLIAALPELIKQAPEIIKAIIQGLQEAWPDIQEAGKQLIDEIKKGISAVWEKIKAIGKNIIDGILQGLKDAWQGVKDWFAGVVGSLRGTAHIDVEKSEGPGHAIGLDYVPYNNYAATLHRGEAVLTRSEAEAWRSGQYGGGRIVNINIQTTDLDQSKVDYIIRRANQELGGALA